MLVEKLSENEYCIDIFSLEECQQLAVAIGGAIRDLPVQTAPVRL